MNGAGYTVAVRALCAFTARQGDLDLRFTPSPSAQEGIAGHATVTGRRGAHYETEVALNGSYRHLQVRGRADGYDAKRNRVEEIKTFRGKLEAVPDNHRHLHWAQAKIYGWLLCASRGLACIDVALVYFDIVSQKETVLVESWTADALREHFERQCERFITWADEELRHRAARDAALKELAFPHEAFRRGQRELAEAVYRGAVSGRCLLAQAPTGIGKTIATLFPLLKAAPGQSLDRIFFLTAKTPGRALALEAVALLRRTRPALPLRVLELTARDKACEHPDKACHGESCPLAQGFYDRIAAAREQAVAAETLDRASLRAIALTHDVCPYYLAQELAHWCDVVVGDYNYYFDASALLYGLTVENQWRVALLVDEAHNLIDRARGMYTAELDQTALHFARKSAPPALKKSLDRVQRQWNALTQDQEEDYLLHAAVPDKFQFALLKAGADIADAMAEQPDGLPEDLQRFHFDALHFMRLAEVFGDHSLFDATRQTESGHGRKSHRTTLCLRNVVPAPFLKARFDAAHCATLFSATLSPPHFQIDMLGLPDDTAWMDVASPFDADQLAVHVARHISTRYRDRHRSLDAVADLLARQYRERPGNYLAFFSSYDYLEQVAAAFTLQHAAIPAWQQARRMQETERTQFLERFVPGGQGIGFAVLGGAFGEGIDLPGDRLIGAFVATLGLPQLNPVNEQMRQRMDALFGCGYDYAYLYPGLQKVVQAAGRVIRTQHDRGVLHLIDDRFGRADVRALLPGWWNIGG